MRLTSTLKACEGRYRHTPVRKYTQEGAVCRNIVGKNMVTAATASSRCQIHPRKLYVTKQICENTRHSDEGRQCTPLRQNVVLVARSTTTAEGDKYATEKVGHVYTRSLQKMGPWSTRDNAKQGMCRACCRVLGGIGVTC